MARWCTVLFEKVDELVTLTGKALPQKGDLKFVGLTEVHGRAFFSFPQTTNLGAGRILRVGDLAHDGIREGGGGLVVGPQPADAGQSGGIGEPGRSGRCGAGVAGGAEPARGEVKVGWDV